MTTASKVNGQHDEIPLHSPILAYFPPTAHLPIPSHPTSPSIIASLLSTAGVDVSLYPSRTYTELQTLISAIQHSSFDTLRRDALLYYLLLDYHLLPPPDKVSTPLTFSTLPPRPPILEQFAANHLLPAFWTDAVERGFWRFDKGLYQEALPWLNATNSGPYANHILRTLSPIKTGGALLDSVHNARCLIKYYRIAKPTLPDTIADKDVIEAVVVAKALVEGLQSALTLIRDRQRVEQDGLFATFWHWLFHLQVGSSSRKVAQVRSSLLQSVVALPLAEAEVQTLVIFSLGKSVPWFLSENTSPSTALLQARQLALDTLLVRLINQGRVLDALKLNKLAEESQSSPFSIGEDGGEAAANRRKKRREMLRLAKDMLPEVVRSQLETLAVSSNDEKRPQGVREDWMEEDVPSHGSGRDESPAPVSIATATANTSFSGVAPSPHVRSYMQQRLADSNATSRLRLSTGAATPPPLPSQRSTPSQQRPHVPLVSQSPLSLPASRTSIATPQFSRGSPSTNHFDPSSVGYNSTSGEIGAGQGEEGPYARLAAQLASQTNGDRGGHAEADDESLLLASLLPQKRTLSTRRQEGDETDATALMGGRENASDRSEGPGASSRGGFEVPKRRYTKKDQDQFPAGAGSRSKSRDVSASPARPKEASGRSKAGESSKRGTSGLRQSTTMGNLATHAAAAGPPFNQARSSQTEPLTRASEGDSGSKKTPRVGGTKGHVTSTPTSTRRSTRAQSESVPGSFPGAEGPIDGDEEHDKEEEVEGDKKGRRRGSAGRKGGYEMETAEVKPSSRSATRGAKSQEKTSTREKERSASPVKRSSAATTVAGGTTGTPRRSGRAKTPSGSVLASGGGGVPTESTPVRRSARRRTPPPQGRRTPRGAAKGGGSSSRASSVLSSRYGDDDDDDEDGDEDDEGEAEEGEEAQLGGEASGRGIANPKARTRTGRGSTRTRTTRSMSVLSSGTAGQDEERHTKRDGGGDDIGEQEEGDETATKEGGGTRNVRRSARRH